MTRLLWPHTDFNLSDGLKSTTIDKENTYVGADRQTVDELVIRPTSYV